jgi:hypothetical protein
MKTVAKQFLSMFMMAGLLFVPALQAQQDQQAHPQNVPVPPPGGGVTGGGYGSVPKPPTTLATSVFQVAQSKMVTLQKEAVVGTLKSADVASASTALQNVFANMDETGYTVKLQSWILANADLFTTQNPTTAQLETAYATFSGTGVTETYSQFVQRITGVPLNVRQAFITAVQQSGLDYVHSQILSAMNATASMAQINRLNGGHLIQANLQGPSWWAIGAEYLAIVGVSMAVIASAPAVVIAIGVAGAAMGAVDIIESLDDAGGC